MICNLSVTSSAVVSMAVQISLTLIPLGLCNSKAGSCISPIFRFLMV